MGDPKGFLQIPREDAGYRPVEERLNDFSEVEKQLSENERKKQASRCMDCAVPFCHWACPVNNIMPEWQDMIHKGDWKTAYDLLQATNCFPEFTGRVCPAPCETSCVLSINSDAVTIRQNELSIIEKAYQEKYIKPNLNIKKTGKKIAVIGGGPAGMACSDRLTKNGHDVTLYEASDAIGGYLRYGIPDFKLSKDIIDRRLNIMTGEGLTVKTNTEIGKDVSIKDLQNQHDAICITIGARVPRDLPIEGRDLKGIHFAVDYLSQQNKIIRKVHINDNDLIKAIDKHVIVIGGGDTGSDCVGTSNRQSAMDVTQIELLPKPPKHRTENDPWPIWPKLLKTSSSHEEGCERMWNILTKRFIGENGIIKKIIAVKVEWIKDNDGKDILKELPGTEFELEADLVLLAMGFIHPVHKGLINDLGVKLNERGNIAIDENCMTNIEGVFAAGDSSRGASLIVWAIHDGIKAAQSIDAWLKHN